jgi:myosin-crossreactive antigen
VEYSVRSAQVAVDGLLGIDRKVLPMDGATTILVRSTLVITLPQTIVDNVKLESLRRVEQLLSLTADKNLHTALVAQFLEVDLF